MLFSSLIFLYLFLPLTLLGYYLSPSKIKNYWLLITSLVFFAWGGVSLTALLIISIVFNYFAGLLLYRYRTATFIKWLLAATIGVNILLLGTYKYANFLVENINHFSTVLGFTEFKSPGFVLPVGISFYTFHSLSYLVDIYRGKTPAQNNIFKLALYITMFSQLIAGPIIRYSDVWLQLDNRKHNLTLFRSGIERFILGLAKKVLIANTFARVADAVFNNNCEDIGAPLSWLGIICYTFQIYYDFSGYSDMAIGLGRMFGFQFMENFNLPYVAGSVKEFWRRWHISLSTFFRDYVYIPLGGNRLGGFRTYFNLIAVFFLTGFWHGASWNFVIWGLFHGVFMLLEKAGLESILEKTWKPIASAYTFLVVLFAWVLFRADTFEYTLGFWRSLFDFELRPDQVSAFMLHFDNEFLCYGTIGVLGAFGLFTKSARIIKRLSPADGFPDVIASISELIYANALIALLVVCSTYLLAGTYNPFIYYRF